jgi:hypothetical protein
MVGDVTAVIRSHKSLRETGLLILAIDFQFTLEICIALFIDIFRCA